MKKCVIALLFLCASILSFSQEDSAVNVAAEVTTGFHENLDHMVNLWFIQQSALYSYTNRPEDIDSAYVPEFSREEYEKRIAKMNSVIPLLYNNQVHAYIQVYGFRRREQVEIMMGLAEYYFPIFEEILEIHNVPQELKYLAVIESALNPRARSRMGAVGLWQFMPATGRMMGLAINSFVDERRDPILSTHAAALYLKQLHGMFNDWTLALAAYNCGPGNVRKAITRSGGRRDFWEIYRFLPRETRGYVPAYIAAYYVFEHHADHNLYPRRLKYPAAVDTVMVTEAMTFNQIAQVLEMPQQLLEDLNPKYKLGAIPKTEEGMTLYLPVEFISPFLHMQDMVVNYRDSLAQDSATIAKVNSIASNTQVPVYYTIKSGDNLSLIASWFDVRIADLREWNNIRGNTIVAGRRMTIYVPEHKQAHYAAINSMSFAQKQRLAGNTVARPEPQPQQQASSSGRYETYTVRSGDTLWDIAQKYDNVSIADLRRLNDLSNSSRIHPGMVLKIRSL